VSSLPYDNQFEGANVQVSATATPLLPDAVNNSGTITGYGFGVRIDGSGSVINTETIQSTGTSSNGVRLNAGGYIYNDGLITGATGIKAYRGAATITNYANILGVAGYAAAIALEAGGNIVNHVGALIQAPALGVLIDNAYGAVTNFGTMAATNANGTGIWLSAGGSVANADTAGYYGYIRGYDAVVIGSNAGGSGAVVNEGSIAGGNVGVGVCTVTERGDRLAGAADRSPAIRRPRSASREAGLQRSKPTKSNLNARSSPRPK